MVNAFGSRVNHSLVHLLLPLDVLEVIQSGEIKLTGLPVPDDLSPTTKAAIKELIAKAFVIGFRIVMLICAGLSAASSAAAWLMKPKGTPDLSLARSER
jgi:hypothetical protein